MEKILTEIKKHFVDYLKPRKETKMENAFFYRGNKVGGGGGGGGGFSIENLSPVGAQDIGTLTLNDSILNYDVIIVECCRDTAPAQRGNIWLPVAIIDQASSYRRYRCVCPTGSSGQDAAYDFYFQNNNQIVKSYSYGSFLYSVRGVKFG